MNPYKRARECGFSQMESIVMTVVPFTTAMAPIVYGLSAHLDVEKPYESALAIAASMGVGIVSGAVGFACSLVGCAIYTAGSHPARIEEAPRSK